jgi:hypothetical protein
MAWYDDGANLAWPNVLMIAGGAMLAPVLLPAVSFVVRPAVKGVVKAGHGDGFSGRRRGTGERPVC